MSAFADHVRCMENARQKLNRVLEPDPHAAPMDVARAVLDNLTAEECQAICVEFLAGEVVGST